MVLRKKAVTDAPAGPQSDHGFYHELDRVRKHRACLTFGNCGCLLFLVIVVATVAVLGAIAATGIIRVAGLSDLVYPEPPEPARIVEPESSLSLATLLAEVAPPADGQPASLVLTERQLTYLLRQPTADGRVPLKQGQVAVGNDEIEIFGQVATPSDDQATVLRVILVPGSGSEVLQLASVQVGYLPVPARFAHQVLRLLIGGDPLSNDTLAQVGIVDVSPSSGSVTVLVSPTVPD
ncbi:hypothetical protein HY375_02675 [Candidatus Berkelbacteria bacterium]|nr:hypothetical protein [Candidatus Berkelbacteria bacterium]